MHCFGLSLLPCSFISRLPLTRLKPPWPKNHPFPLCRAEDPNQGIETPNQAKKPVLGAGIGGGGWDLNALCFLARCPSAFTKAGEEQDHSVAKATSIASYDSRVQEESSLFIQASRVMSPWTSASSSPRDFTSWHLLLCQGSLCRRPGSSKARRKDSL